MFCHILTDSHIRSELSMCLRIQLFNLNVAAFLSFRSRSDHRFAIIHGHCIQSFFHIPLIQLNMLPTIFQRKSTLEKIDFFLISRPQAHNFSLLYQEKIFFGATRNMYSAHSKFSENTRAKKMVDGSGKPDERDSSSAQIRTLLDEQRQTIIADYREKVGHHELQAAQAEEERRLLQGQMMATEIGISWNSSTKSYRNERITEISEFCLRYYSKKKLIEDQNTILELSGRIQDLQNEVNRMNDSEDFQDAESIRSGNSHVTSRPVSLLIQYLKECFDSLSYRRAAKKGRQAFGTHMVYRETFLANPPASSSAPYPQELNQWNSSIEEPLHMSTVEKSERPEQNQDLRCQSRPSAKDSVILSGGNFSKNYGAEQQRLQISDLHFDKFPTPATFACWR